MESPRFLVVGGPDKDRVIVIQNGVNMMGRKEEALYKINDPRVSRFHCEIELKGEFVIVRDKGGAGGTIVNSSKITEHMLKNGDLVQVGETLMRFQTQAAASMTTGTSTIRDLAQPAEYDPQATDQLIEMVGRTLSHYRIKEEIGKGESGMTFKAVDTNDNKVLALKVMQPAFAQDEEEMQRFVRAMKTMMPLKHENIVQLYSAGKSGPYCWVAMEYVDGENMTEVIKRIGIAGMLDWKYAFRVGVHIGRALEYAHGEGIIHRGVTPPNIILRSSDKQALLGDLMLAKALEGTNAKQVTKPGELVGDLNYMSPERTRGTGEGVDGRSDLFGLAATMYALLTGKPPFAGSSMVETITRIRNAEPLKPTTFQMGIPGLFETTILKMLAKRPEDRFQTAGEVVRELERIGKYNGVTV